MAMVTCHDITFYLDKGMMNYLDQLIIHCKQENDLMFLFTGPEGAGKSRLRDQIAAYLSHKFKMKFGLDNIHFNTKDYMRHGLHSPPYTIISHDEARRDLNRMRTTSKVSVQFTDYLSECRDDNLIHMIILPSFHDINPSVALWRTKIVIDVRLHPKTKKRGFYYVYKTGNKKLLAKIYKDKYSKFPASLFKLKGKFSGVSILDEAAYKKKKKDNKMTKYGEDGEVAPEVDIKVFDRVKKNYTDLINHLCTEKMLTKTLIAEIVHVDRKTLYKDLNSEETGI